VHTVDLGHENNPLIVADEISIFISDGLREGAISLYSGFLLNQEELSLRRLGYRQAAWGHDFSLSGVLRLYMQYLFSLVAAETTVTRVLINWLQEDLPLLREDRDHYVKKHLVTVPVSGPTRELLEELSEIRSNYQKLSDDSGPFHNEVFPYDYCSPEDILLGHRHTPVEKGTMEPPVQDLMLAIDSWRTSQ